MDFKIKGDAERLRLMPVTIASGTVIEAGDLCELANGLPIKGSATGTRLAYAPIGSATGETTIFLSIGTDFTLIGTGENAHAIAYMGDECDLILSGADMLIDNDTVSTKVFLLSCREDAGVVGSAENISFRINDGHAIY